MKSFLKPLHPPHYAIRIVSMLFAVFLLWSCSEEGAPIPLDEAANQKIVIKSTLLESSPLMAGQTTNAGSINFFDLDTNNDGIDDAMEFCYQTIDGWELVETHFWIGTDKLTLPVNRSGNPVPGLFPYKSGSLAAGTTQWCIRIPMSTIGFSCPGSSEKDFYIAAHAALRKVSGGIVTTSETGWGQGDRIVQKGNWGMYMLLTISCDAATKDPVCDSNGTAIAKAENGAVCFDVVNDLLSTSLCSGSDEFDLPNPDRWGWTNFINGAPTTVMTLYAGGAQCNTEKGTVVGTATVSYSAGKAKVTIQMTNGSLGAAHVYIGEDPLYLDMQYSGQGGITINCPASGYTVAPGQQPLQSGILGAGTTSWSTPDVAVDGTFYVYVHIDALEYCK